MKTTIRLTIDVTVEQCDEDQVTADQLLEQFKAAGASYSFVGSSWMGPGDWWIVGEQLQSVEVV